MFEVSAELFEPDSPSGGQAFVAAPSPQQYVTAFRELSNLTESPIHMLRIHYYAPDRTITAAQMVRAVGYGHYSVANLQYGPVGRLVGEQLDYTGCKMIWERWSCWASCYASGTV